MLIFGFTPPKAGPDSKIQGDPKDFETNAEKIRHAISNTK